MTDTTDTTNDTTTDTSSTSSSGGKTAYLAADNITGNETSDMEKIKTVLTNGGWTVTTKGVGPNTIQTAGKSGGAEVGIFLVGGSDAGMYYDFKMGIKNQYYKYDFMWVAFDSWSAENSWVTPEGLKNKKLVRAHDDNYSGSGISEVIGKTAQEYFSENSQYIGMAYGNSAEEVANMILTGSPGGGSSSTVEVVEGFIESGRGESPQFWNLENYEEYSEIYFTKFEIIDENPRIKTATFTSTERIDLTCGRVAVLITGDCNEFGGIILSRSYDTESMLYEYQCQGFMDRIMANEVNLVANGGKTTHQWIKEILADLSLPDVNLLEPDEYDTAITEENKKKLQADADLTEESSNYASRQESSSSDSNSSSDNANQTQIDNANEDIKNPFKRSPKGLYDKFTISELIRTLIFDYGVNVDFYGDVNGIPHFDIMELEEWKKTGWYLSPNLGFESDYDYKFDITDIVTQVAVKNVSAVNGTGEIYTSEELLGVALENYVGRMGTVVDNPSANGTASTSNSEESVSYQDADGNKVDSSKVLTSSGYPSCSQCKVKNGGSQPEYQTYTKYWLNKCTGCNEEGKLSYTTTGDKDGRVVCSSCKLYYCSYCGSEKTKNSYQLSEVFKVTSSSSGDNSDSNGSNDGSSGSGSGTSNS